MKKGKWHRRSFMQILGGATVVGLAGRAMAAVSADMLVRIDLGGKVVSGFVAELKGKTYVFTNAQLISGHDRFTITTLSGESVQLKKIELSATRDLARFLVDKRPSMEIDSAVTAGESISVYDYTMPGSVHSLPGRVAKVHEGRFQAESGFSVNHYGSPVTKENGSVCGIATLANFYMYSSDDWKSATIRTVYQLEGDTWYSPRWKKYNSTYGKTLRVTDDFRNDIYDMAKQWMADPQQHHEASEGIDYGLDVERWLKQCNGLVTAIEDATKAKKNNDRYRSVRKDFSDCCTALVDICHNKARNLDFLAKDQKISPFLKKEFFWRAKELNTFASYIRFQEEKTLDLKW